MGHRLRLTLRMLGSSLRILWHHPEFLLFPTVSAIALVIILTTLATAVLAAVDFDLSVVTGLGFWGQTAGYFVLYLICYLVAFFANTGLVGAVMMTMDGGTPTLRDSYDIARARAGRLVVYALIMATAGVFFRLLGRWLGVPGRLASPLMRRVVVFTYVGLAWNLITYLVVPVLVVENIGPGQALKRSTELIKRTWGEQVVAYVSTGMIFLLFLMAWLAAGSPMISWAAGTMNQTIITATIYLFVMVTLTAFLVKLSIDSIFCAVVYRYVTDADPGEFDADLLQSAFGAKPNWLTRRARRQKPPEAA